MKASFDFIPAFCPNCGQPVKMTRYVLKDFRAGETVSCDCGAELAYRQPEPEHPVCANCGNLLEDDGLTSKVWKGRICDDCYDMERS